MLVRAPNKCLVPTRGSPRAAQANCRPIVFAAEVLRVASELYKTNGEDSYEKQWVDHPVPIRQLHCSENWWSGCNED